MILSLPALYAVTSCLQYKNYDQVIGKLDNNVKLFTIGQMYLNSLLKLWLAYITLYKLGLNFFQYSWILKIKLDVKIAANSEHFDGISIKFQKAK